MNYFKYPLVVLSISFIMVSLNCAHSFADSFLTAGAGVGNSEHSRLINAGVRLPLVFNLIEQYEIGFWVDPRTNGYSGSGYAANLVGVEVKTNPLVLRAMIGPAIITNTDILLGGIFPQFTEDFFVGIIDNTGNSIGAKYKHLSSAGIYSPNVGRDFVGLEISIAW